MAKYASMKKPENKAKLAKPTKVHSFVAGMSNSHKDITTPSTDKYDAPKIDAARLRLYQSINQAESDIVAGRTVEAHTAINDIRSRYRL